MRGGVAATGVLLALVLAGCGAGPPAGSGGPVPIDPPSPSISTLSPLPMPSMGPPPGEIVADLRQSYMNYVKAARALPDDRFGEGKTINRMLEGSGSGHYAEHLPALQDYRKTLGA